jgi:hypothetical protein
MSSFSGRIQYLGAGQDRLADEGLQPVLWHHIYRALQERGEFPLHAAQGHKADMRFRLEFHQYVHIALGAKIIAQRRPKEGQART